MHSAVFPRLRFGRMPRRTAALAILPLLLIGCGSGRRADAGASPDALSVVARVENNLVPAVALTISLIPEQGERRTIGVVAAGTSGEFRVPVRGGTDPHRLLAEPASGAGTVSRRFELANASAVQWNVGRNALDVSVRP